MKNPTMANDVATVHVDRITGLPWAGTPVRLANDLNPNPDGRGIRKPLATVRDVRELARDFPEYRAAAELLRDVPDNPNGWISATARDYPALRRAAEALAALDGETLLPWVWIVPHPSRAAAFPPEAWIAPPGYHPATERHGPALPWWADAYCWTATGN